MKRQQISQQISFGIFVILLLAACHTQTTQIAPTLTPTLVQVTSTPLLRGAADTPMVFIETPPVNIKITDFYIIEEADLDIIRESKKTIPAIFSSGTKQLTIVVVICPPLENGVDVTVDIIGNNGLVKVDEVVSVLTLTQPDRCITVVRDFKPLSGKYEDGPYQARLSINNIVVALLNWTVGPL